MSAREIPLLFMGDMVLALLDGRKTQTRRLRFTGRPGDVVWGKETWQAHPRYEALKPREIPSDSPLVYAAGHNYAPWAGGPWRSPLFMPRWASRITRMVLDVREQRLQNITEEDALAEGITRNDGRWYDGAPHRIKGTPKAFPTARAAFADLWDYLNADKAPWASNPLVRVITFEESP